MNPSLCVCVCFGIAVAGMLGYVAMKQNYNVVVDVNEKKVNIEKAII